MPATTESGPRTPLILGFLIGGAVLIGLSMFANGKRGSAPAAVPHREIIVPDTAVMNPVVLRFRTPADLQLTHMGWMADDMHLHVVTDSVDLMPGAEDLTPMAGDTFAWRLPPMSAGEHYIRLFWSDERHVPRGDTTVALIRVR